MSARLLRIADRTVFTEESGDGAPVIMVHGLGGTSSCFEPLAAGLSRQYRTIRYDFNGHGRTPLRPPVTIGSLTDELEALVATMADRPVCVIAHSMGTLIALQLAADRPEMIDRMVLISPVRGASPAAGQAMSDRAALARSQGMAAIAESALTSGTSRSARESNPLLTALIRELLLGQDSEAYAQACEARAGARDCDLRGVGAPVLLLSGSEDPLSSAELTARLTREMPQARQVTLARCGHWPLIERAPAVLAAVSAFLQSDALPGQADDRAAHQHDRPVPPGYE
ncbi:alpha/beta fold hydrolase [Streptomyces sp. NPDC008121]|uniref:alpha/beta fold hydrolase n=1 Tax=Streptomyces sp. NPDC008121 TaxID=3364809 RepID=UPI0036E2A6AA